MSPSDRDRGRALRRARRACAARRPSTPGSRCSSRRSPCGRRRSTTSPRIAGGRARARPASACAIEAPAACAAASAAHASIAACGRRAASCSSWRVAEHVELGDAAGIESARYATSRTSASPLAERDVARVAAGASRAQRSRREIVGGRIDGAAGRAARARSRPSPAAIASVEPSSSMCAVPALTTTATSGSAIFVRYSICPMPRMPISTTPNWWNRRSPSSVSGTPVSLLSEPSAACVVPAERERGARQLLRRRLAGRAGDRDELLRPTRGDARARSCRARSACRRRSICGTATTAPTLALDHHGRRAGLDRVAAERVAVVRLAADRDVERARRGARGCRSRRDRSVALPSPWSVAAGIAREPDEQPDARARAAAAAASSRSSKWIFVVPRIW